MKLDELWQLNSTTPTGSVHYVRVQNKPYRMTDGMGVRADHWQMIAKWHIKRKSNIRVIIEKFLKWVEWN